MSPTLRPQESAALSLVARLDHHVRQSKMYPDGHAALHHATQAIAELAATIAQDQPASVFLVGGRVLLADRLLRPTAGARQSVRDLSASLLGRGVGGITLSPGVSEAHIQPFVRVLLDFPPDGTASPAAINRALHERGVTTLQVEAPRTAVDAEDAGGQADPALSALRIYLRALRLAQAYEAGRSSPALTTEREHLAALLVELHDSAPRRALALIRPKELISRSLQHPVHTAIIAIAIGHATGLTVSQKESLTACALGLSLGLEPVPVDDEDDDERSSSSRARQVDPATATANLRLARAATHLFGAAELEVRALRTLVEYDLGADHTGPPGVLRWPELHPFSQILLVAGTFDRLCHGTPERRALSAARAVSAMTGHPRFPEHTVSALQALLPELEVIRAYA